MSGFNDLPRYGYYQVVLTQGQFKYKDEYSVVSLLDLAGKGTGIALTLYGVISFFIGHYQQFVVNKSMLKMLYQEHDENQISKEPIILQTDES